MGIVKGKLQHVLLQQEYFCCKDHHVAMNSVPLYMYNTVVSNVKTIKFLVLTFFLEILSNLFVYVNILAITIQQVCSNKILLVWSIWPQLSQIIHTTPCCGPGSQLWCANGRGLYLALTTKFGVLRGLVWGQFNEGSMWPATGVVYHKM